MSDHESSEHSQTCTQEDAPLQATTSNNRLNTLGKSRRSVRFPEADELLCQVVCYLPTREELGPEALAEVFFTKADFQTIRVATRRAGHECERYGHSKYLDDAYTEKSSDTQSRLNYWALHGNLYRGVERSANKKHGEEREQVQFNSIMAVLRAHDEMACNRLGGGIVDAEKLRKVSHKATKVARHFARMMGKADHYAATQPEPDEKSDHTVNTEVSSSFSIYSTTPDDISVPRMPRGNDHFSSLLSTKNNKGDHHHDMDDSVHHGESSSSPRKKGRSRLPRFMQRSWSGRRDEHKQNLIESCI